VTTAQRKRPRTNQLSCLHSRISLREPLHFPDQKKLTQLTQAAHPGWSKQSLTEAGKLRTEHLSKQTIDAYCTEGETADFLQKAGKFPKESKIRHSPLAFTTHTESLAEFFSRDLFAVLLCFILGMPAPLCLQKRGVTECESCHQQMDKFGHHRMTCNQTASYMGTCKCICRGSAKIVYSVHGQGSTNPFDQ
jgi:hypothetical protein